jgi:hypothetical protein
VSNVQGLDPDLPTDEMTVRGQSTEIHAVLNEATRHLCVGTYVDHEYCTEVLRRVYFDGSRRLAPSYGFALPPVLVHAGRAWRLDLGQHVAVVAAATAALIVDPFTLAAATAILISWYVLRRLARLGPALARFLATRTHPQEDERIRAQGAVFGIVLVASWGALLLLVVLTGGAARLRELGSFPLWDRTAGLIAFVTAIAACVAVFRQRAVDKLQRGATEPNWRHNGRLLNLEQDGRRPVTVYSGFRPFVGSGLEWRTWSFAQLLVPKDGAKAPDGEDPRFTTAELVERVKERIGRLALDPDPERQLPELTVRDHIFVIGTHAGYVAEYPEEKDFVDVMSDTTKHTRHFLACQVPSWEGEVVTSVYVHVSLQGRTLYLEFSTWALPPTNEEFHVVDRVGGTGLRAHIRTIAVTVWTLPETLVRARRSLVTFVFAIGAKVAGERWIALQARGIDVGATMSVRELGAEVETDEVVGLTMTTDINYFQYRDIVKHSKVIERRLLATVLEFLQDRGIDTAEYEQRTITILNAGIVQTGSGKIDFTGVIGEGTFNNAPASEGQQ